MKRKINSRYLQCKEAYLDGYKEGFTKAYDLVNASFIEAVEEMVKKLEGDNK